MKVIIRTDSSLAIGTGHLMRGLTLAECLRKNNVEVVFVCRELPGNVIDIAESRGFKVHHLPLGDERIMNDSNRPVYDRWRAVEKDFDAGQTREILTEKEKGADWLVVDHYGLDGEWETPMRAYVNGIMVIDDLANRNHDCDLLLDQNLYENLNTRYDGRVANMTVLLLGPEYVLLRDEFKQSRLSMKKRDGRVKRILVSFGGADSGNDTIKTLEIADSSEFKELTFEVVVGKTNPHADDIKRACAALPRVNFHYNISNMAKMMAGTDLCVGAGGTSTWERCCMGLPSVTLAVAENQIEVARLSEKAGYARYLGVNHAVDSARIHQAVLELISNRENLHKMSTIGMELVDGLGVEKVVNNILKSVPVKK